MERWNGKVVVVTGAGAGIGAAIAETLALKGMVVVGLDKNEGGLKKVSMKSRGAGLHPIKCDIRNESEVTRAFEKIERDHGGVDLLINSAAVIDLSGFVDGSSDVWKSIIETNLFGTMLCCRAALKTMRNRGDHGQIINFNSISGHKVLNLYKGPLGAYPSAKHGVTAFTESLRIELRNMGSCIRVTSLSPGFVNTDMAKQLANNIGIPYDPSSDDVPPWALACQDIVDAVVNIISMNPRVEVQELTLQRNTPL